MIYFHNFPTEVAKFSKSVNLNLQDVYNLYIVQLHIHIIYIYIIYIYATLYNACCENPLRAPVDGTLRRDTLIPCRLVT